jgi:hypothetical protein
MKKVHLPQEIVKVAVIRNYPVNDTQTLLLRYILSCNIPNGTYRETKLAAKAALWILKLLIK